MWESKQQSLLMNRRGGYNPVIYLMSPSLEAFQPHHSAHLSRIMSLKSTPQLKFHQHFSTQILPSQALGFVLNL